MYMTVQANLFFFSFSSVSVSASVSHSLSLPLPPTYHLPTTNKPMLPSRQMSKPLLPPPLGLPPLKPRALPQRLSLPLPMHPAPRYLLLVPFLQRIHHNPFYTPHALVRQQRPLCAPQNPHQQPWYPRFRAETSHGREDGFEVE